MKLVDDTMYPTGPTDPELQAFVNELRKTGKDFFVHIADRLEKPRRKKNEVNVGAIGNAAEKNESVVVPAKVLGGGEITKPVKIYAWKFSAEAKNKIAKAGGKCLPLSDIMKSKENVKLIV